ncbi:SDR family NAD(P)-dependent oxidoreductase [Oribacterium sp. WCC10]|uniref:SDR family NAD(P)-dependent oxidoreductase n=1 Tax=Oribacterium sp. WCC10 TaxID=1855343 RepID=UPI0008E2CEB5|nr:SDR family oxidoreductase [Oribacterium sp. WCC10]SFG65090.1 3-oxoacyl-[acyl-carrier protein] reductase [Oribacterium sp. WCC10]
MLTGKVCIVTGGSRGIGKAISQVFAQNGATVYAIATREGSVEEWSEEFNKDVSGEVRSLYFDISDERAARDGVMQIKRACGYIDGLVNNAGVEFNELIGMISHDNMEKMFSVNVYGTINMLQMVSRIMGRQETGGSIVNITSMTALRGNKGQLVYSATKGAVISLTKSAAKELAEKKIRVNAIAPGLTNTDMMKQADPEKLQSRINNICMGHLAEPEDIAKACLFMVSDLSTYVSGQVLAVDGCTIM